MRWAVLLMGGVLASVVGITVGHVLVQWAMGRRADPVTYASQELPYMLGFGVPIGIFVFIVSYRAMGRWRGRQS